MTHLRGSRAAYYQLRFDVRRPAARRFVEGSPVPAGPREAEEREAVSTHPLPPPESPLAFFERRPLNPGLAIVLVFFVLPGLAEFLAEVLT